MLAHMLILYYVLPYTLFILTVNLFIYVPTINYLDRSYAV